MLLPAPSALGTAAGAEVIDLEAAAEAQYPKRHHPINVIRPA